MKERTMTTLIDGVPIEKYIPGFPFDHADETAEVEWGSGGGMIAIYIDGETRYFGPVIANQAKLALVEQARQEAAKV